MLPRLVRCSVLFAFVASTLALAASAAHAQDASPTAAPGPAPAAAPPPPPPEPPAEEIPPGLRGPRIGLTPGIGVGFVGFTGNVTFPSFVFTTAIQAELLVELTRWGFFFRGGFLSSGSGGRWTAPVVALGTQYRLVGDGEERWGVVVRSAFGYERWSAGSAQVGCDVLYVFPNSCQDYVAPPDSAPGTVPVASAVVADTVGVLTGLRLEAPVDGAYIAFDGELSVAADVDQAIPGVAVAGQLVLTFALRDHPRPDNGTQTSPRRRLHPF